ncbi:MAG: hypothetical protein ABFE13_11435 [Phycisphaerales bacterium]
MGSHKALISRWQDATGNRGVIPTNDQMARWIAESEALPAQLAAIKAQSDHDWAGRRQKDQWDEDPRMVNLVDRVNEDDPRLGDR